MFLDDGEDLIPGYVLKRSFWSPHPSDYNPMRRPGPLPRNIAAALGRSSQETKRTHPYHPLPRNTALKQREAESFVDDYAFDEGLNGNFLATFSVSLNSQSVLKKPNVASKSETSNPEASFPDAS